MSAGDLNGKLESKNVSIETSASDGMAKFSFLGDTNGITLATQGLLTPESI